MADQMKKLRHLFGSTNIRTEVLNGENYQVFPTIMILEGVHNGVFYSKEELAIFPLAWNGRPVVVHHPTKDGEAITANSPEEMEKRTIGVIYNTTWKDDKLKAEVWINTKKAETVAPDVLNALMNGLKMDVSTGMFQLEEQSTGYWNGEPYVAVAHHIRPDHLALLPGAKGACSWEDGAGIPRINKQQETNMRINAEVQLVLARLGLSHGDIHELLRQAVNGLGHVPTDERGGSMVVDVFNNFVVFDQYDLEEKKWKLRKCEYKKSENNTVTLVGEPVPVYRDVRYLPVSENAVVAANKEEPPAQGGKEINMERKQKIDALIAANGAWVEEDRPALEAMPDAQFNKLAELKKVEAPKVAANSAEFAEQAPEAFRDEVKTGLAMLKEKRDGLITTIAANSKFKPEQLASKSMEELEVLHDMATKTVARFDAKPAGTEEGKTPTVNNDKNQVPAMPTLSFTK